MHSENHHTAISRIRWLVDEHDKRLQEAASNTVRLVDAETDTPDDTVANPEEEAVVAPDLLRLGAGTHREPITHVQERGGAFANLAADLNEFLIDNMEHDATEGTVEAQLPSEVRKSQFAVVQRLSRIPASRISIVLPRLCVDG